MYSSLHNVIEMKLFEFYFKMTFLFWSNLNCKMIEKCDTKTVKMLFWVRQNLKFLNRIFVVLVCWRETNFLFYSISPPLYCLSCKLQCLYRSAEGKLCGAWTFYTNLSEYSGVLFQHMWKSWKNHFFVLAGSDAIAWDLACIPWCYFLYELSSQRTEGWKKRFGELLSLFFFIHSADGFVICSTLQCRLQHFHQCSIQQLLKVNIYHDTVPCCTPINQSMLSSKFFEVTHTVRVMWIVQPWYLEFY